MMIPLLIQFSVPVHLNLGKGAPSASLQKYGEVCGERDGGEFAKRRRRDASAHREGGATKKSMPARRHPLG